MQPLVPGRGRGFEQVPVDQVEGHLDRGELAAAGLVQAGLVQADWSTIIWFL